jgi:hypothetical protein
MDYSLRGRALDLGLKPAEVRVTLSVGPGVAGYRFIWRTAADGIYLSTYAGDAGGLAAAFEHSTSGAPVQSLTITTNAPWEWEASVCVDFFSVAPPNRGGVRSGSPAA